MILSLPDADLETRLRYVIAVHVRLHIEGRARGPEFYAVQAADLALRAEARAAGFAADYAGADEMSVGFDGWRSDLKGDYQADPARALADAADLDERLA